MKANEDFTILIVDDIPENLQVLGSILDEQGYTISFAQNGKEAVEQAKEIKFDLILCDVMMPIMDGFQAADELKKLNSTRDIPIIFLTAKNDKDSIIEGFNHGAADYVTKPFDPSELMARVQTHLQLKYQAEQLANMNKILEQKVKERTLQLVMANEKLESAYSELAILDQAKNNFLQLISHELRTPLNAIVGSISLMESLVEQQDELLDYFELLRSGVERLEKFSSTALLITQLQSGVYSMRNEECSLKLMIHNVLEALEPFASARNINIKNRISSDFNCLVEELLFSKIIYSVIHNAIRFSREYSSVVIDAIVDKGKLVVTVDDSGPGFSELAISQLYKPIMATEGQLDQNIGLSLRLAKIIMDMHKGEIKIERIGEISRVSLMLPVCDS